MTVPTSAPERVTECPPAPSVGTVKVQLKVPVAVVVWAVQVWVDMVPPEMVIEPMFVLGENPEPETATDTPMGPCEGTSAKVGVVTLNGCDVTTVVPK